ncbi:unnamed protein product [Arabidopsis arenosa]|uniref:Carboxypeptidase n=1 Tax=Arabidopsis arenosa TaxID=38785 RepID=A0A8S2B1B1_ARAAE|nr:unnamed protein product [Arabidopsis arenosa]
MDMFQWFAQGYPEEDLVVRLPGQPTVGFKTIRRLCRCRCEAGRSLFYYYVEAVQVVSSIGGGAFTELGPFYPTGDGRGLRVNSMSWNKASNLLFVESPCWSRMRYARVLVEMVRQFPKLKSRDLFLTGESYAGHYIPQLADAILSYNSRSSGFKFNIKGVAIGNPLLKLDRDSPATYEFFWSHGMISDELKLTITSLCDFDDYTFASPHNQELRLKKMATKLSLGVDVCMTYERRFYFNLPEVQKALHANRTHLPYEWSMCSGQLNYSDNRWEYRHASDSEENYTEQNSCLDLQWRSRFFPYGAWFHKSQVGGWAIEYGKLLTFATVRGAAHMVPYAQPSRALHLFSSFVSGRRLPNNTHSSTVDERADF